MIIKLKTLITYILTCCIITSSAVFAVEGDFLDDVISDTAAFLCSSVVSPQIGAVGGDWTVFALARSGYDIPDEYYNKYYKNVCSYLKECGGVLSPVKYTEYSRVVLALSAIGKNPEDVQGYNLLKPLGDYKKTVRQGINGAAWALIALDSRNYRIPVCDEADVQATRDLYIKYILSACLEGGGWSLSGTGAADPDVTGMVLTALSKYRDRADVNAAVNDAVEVLSNIQDKNGGYSSGTSINSQSSIQVLVSLCSLGVYTDDNRFVKNGNTILDNILCFYAKGEGFKNTFANYNGGLMATEQCLYGLAAVKRIEEGKPQLFDISDPIRLSDEAAGERLKLPDEGDYDTNFSDISNIEEKTAIEKLAARGIVSGKDKNIFDPKSTMTRAEFAAIIVKALCPKASGNDKFLDVLPDEWFFKYINTAHEYGIVSGVSDTMFNPNGTITLEEAAVMTSRAAKLCGMDILYSDDAARDILSAFDDYTEVSDWAISALAFCFDKSVLCDDGIYISPFHSVTRAEVAQMLYNMLGGAGLL